jgi:Lon protease-like protein
MVDDAISGARMIGIVQPSTGDGDTESPLGKDVALKRVGCAGRITAYQELDDGRIIMTLTGICRFEVAAEKPTATPYRIVAADFAPFEQDLSPGLGETAVDRAELVAVLKSYLDQHGLQLDWDGIERTSSEFLVNALSIMCPYGPEEKQALLEASDLARRADVLVTLARMELASHGGAGGMLQ